MLGHAVFAKFGHPGVRTLTIKLLNIIGAIMMQRAQHRMPKQ